MLARIVSVLVLLSAAPPALALDACFAASVGPWRGPVWNGLGIQTMETEFHAGPDGMLVGRYRIHDAVSFDGTLTEFRLTGTCEADFTGMTETEPAPCTSVRAGTRPLHRPLGRRGPGRQLVFDGYRSGPNVVS